MVDLLTVIPIWVTYFAFTHEIKFRDIKSFSDFLNYLLYGALRVHKKLAHIEDEVKRTLFNMLLFVLTMVLFGKPSDKYMYILISDSKEFKPQ